jgi:hypothetical protein
VDFQLQQMLEILRGKLVKRGVDVKSLSEGDVQLSGQRATLAVTVQQGIESDIARKLVKQIKDKKLKVQTAIQGDKLRVTGKKRDDLQEVIAFLRELRSIYPCSLIISETNLAGDSARFIVFRRHSGPASRQAISRCVAIRFLQRLSVGSAWVGANALAAAVRPFAVGDRFFWRDRHGVCGQLAVGAFR